MCTLRLFDVRRQFVDILSANHECGLLRPLAKRRFKNPMGGMQAVFPRPSSPRPLASRKRFSFHAAVSPSH